MEMTKQSILKMHPLSHRQENEEEVLIGRTDISNFIILPGFAVEIIQMLDSGLTVDQVEKEMEERFGEPVDVLSFAQDLVTDYRFVYSVDGTIVNESLESKDHFPWITEKVGKFFFNRFAYTIYFLISLSGAAIMLKTGKYFPTYSDIFVSSSITLSLIIAIVTGWCFVMVHEVAHLMAARSLGIGSRIGLNHRLFFPVAETRMSNIVLVPPNRRYRAYFAGMAWDGCFWSICTWILYGTDSGLFSIAPAAVAFIKILNLIFLQNMAFQFMFFMKTDIYYVVTTKLGCNNLLENTLLYLRKFYRKQTDAEQAEWENVSPKEKQVVRWYSLFYVLGFLWSAYFFAAYILRQTIEFIVHIWTGFKGHPILSWIFVDSLVLSVCMVVPLGILMWSWFRSWKQRQLQVPAVENNR